MTAMYQRVEAYILDEKNWIDLGLICIKIFFILILATVVIRIGKTVINRVFTVRQRSPLRYSERRQNTLIKLLENILTYAVYFTAILAILSTFHIDVRGLIAGAGVIGLAIGFGAQSLVKDVITGFFIVFEDQFAVGDEVQIGTSRGIVEEIGLRTTKVKSPIGELFIIPNGTISNVVNYSVFNTIVLIDIKVSYESDIQAVEKMLRGFLGSLNTKYEELVKVPEILGVQEISSDDLVLRIGVETIPIMQDDIARKIRRDLKEFLEQSGVDIPYPIVVRNAKNDE
ncbi:MULTISPECIES: mechanosensitive ion channel family protein [Psychrobacillus]|uniref:Mechanosensitive ion channel family protein n=1 Tax=Psychrobacillus faecigallinarum TaxID=2762235 RepID=A0ABR8RAR5_9BACI|nr:MULTISPECIES: mechanosensitive ion channel family protein [Psychrobacillus]MBD7944883.1 mechanosensitive ion channel family protein [Psychrobacillus faecigallinarum]QEY21400.1 mechanosensitive ion channel family protein [Psychrobacillus sp. AK 1817]QGM31912.1 mechanosensitive ion channel [Bacillus sp. N3536]